MKVFVEKSRLETELRLFQGIFERKTVMEILQNIKVTAFAGGALELVATDLEIGLSANLSLEVAEAGAFTVNGKDLYELVARMPDGRIEISEDNDLQVVVANERRTIKYKLPAQAAAKYPQLPTSDFSTAVKIPLTDFASLIEATHYVISPELKFNIGGALMSISKNRLELAATDGHRLAYSFCMADFSSEEPIDYIVSRKTLLELLKIGSDGELEFAFDKNNLFFRYKNKVLSSRIIDQKFPNYKAVIPDHSDGVALADREELQSMLRRILVFKARSPGVIFKFSPGRLVLERSTPEKGEGYDEMAVEYDGKPVTVGFNGAFILDFLAHTTGDKVSFAMTDGESAFLLRPQTEGAVKLLYIVMPFNV